MLQTLTSVRSAAQQRRIDTALRRSPRVVELSAKKGGLAESYYPFGYSISGPTVTIGAGKWIIHGRLVMTIAETGVTVTGGTASVPHYIYAAHTLGSSTAGIFANAVASFPTSNSTTMKWPLFAVRLDSGVAYIVQILWRGYIQMGLPV